MKTHEIDEVFQFCDNVCPMLSQTAIPPKDIATDGRSTLIGHRLIAGPQRPDPFILFAIRRT